MRTCFGHEYSCDIPGTRLCLTCASNLKISSLCRFIIPDWLQSRISLLMESRMIWFPDIEILSVVESCYWKFVVDGTGLRLISKERSLLSAIRLDIKKESLSKKYVRKVKGSLFHKQEGIINVNKSLLSCLKLAQGIFCLI